VKFVSIHSPISHVLTFVTLNGQSYSQNKYRQCEYRQRILIPRRHLTDAFDMSTSDVLGHPSTSVRWRFTFSAS